VTKRAPATVGGLATSYILTLAGHRDLAPTAASYVQTLIGPGGPQPAQGHPAVLL